MYADALCVHSENFDQPFEQQFIILNIFQPFEQQYIILNIFQPFEQQFIILKNFQPFEQQFIILNIFLVDRRQDCITDEITKKANIEHASTKLW